MIVENKAERKVSWWIAEILMTDLQMMSLP